MKKVNILFVGFFLLLATPLVSLGSNFGQFISYQANYHVSVLDNVQYGISTRPNKVHMGGGLGFGASINDMFNLLIGVDYMTIQPNNARSDYSFDLGYKSYQPFVTSAQLFLPIGFEYYSNTDRSPFQSFYSVHLIPSFSITEKMDIIPFDEFHIAQPNILIEDNGFKFQDFSLQIAINNEFSINENYKVFIEPSIRHSILFRAEDVVNPDYMLSIKIGFKFRGEGKN